MTIYKSLHDRLKNQHETIGELISNINNTRLTFRPSQNKWSIKDNIAHLATYQTVLTDRINTILKKDSPNFDRYIMENDPDFETWRELKIDCLLQKMNSDRHEIFNLITNLTDQNLSRIGQHSKYGNLTIIKWTEFFLLHEAHHIFTIFQLANDTEIRNNI